MKRALKIFLFLAVFAAAYSYVPAKAQCAVCSSNVESNIKNGQHTANGLNHGIMYLLGAPYLAICVVGYVWYKKYRRKNVDINMRDEKLHLN